jgi:hypothetical protein
MLTWRRYPLNKPLTVACAFPGDFQAHRGPGGCTLAHLVTVDYLLLIGIVPDGVELPYVYCAEHEIYFCVSADFPGQIIPFNDDSFNGDKMQ